MKKALVMVAVAGLMSVGLLSQDGASLGAQERQAVGQPQSGALSRTHRAMGGGMGMMARGGMKGGGMREMIADQALAQLATGGLPEEVRPLAEELRLIQAYKSAVDRRVQSLEDNLLLQSPEFKSLCQVYLEALKVYRKTLDANEKIRAALVRLAEIEKNREGMFAAMGGDEAKRRDAFQRMQAEAEEQRHLNEEVAAISKQDEAIAKAAQAKTAAAAAAWALYSTLLDKDAAIQALRADQEILGQAEGELIDALAGAMGRRGPMQNQRIPGHPGRPGPGGTPQPPEPAGLDAGGTPLTPL
jgi:tetratricopeptide (TPR) repeat protein